MKNKVCGWIIGGMAVLFLVGIVLLFSAGEIGQQIGSAAIRANGGSMDTEQFYMIIKSSTLSWQLAGAILSLLGGIGGIVFGAILVGGKE